MCVYVHALFNESHPIEKKTSSREEVTLKGEESVKALNYSMSSQG